MQAVKVIKNSDLDKDLLNKIIGVKSVAWPYSYSEQIKWIEENIKDSDLHLLYSVGDKPLAYLNLIEIEFAIDSVSISGYGIGNVCAIEKGKGWGKELMTFVNKYLEDQKKICLLFCKNELLKFYSENGWNLINNNKLFLNEAHEEIKCMINIEPNFDKLQYSDRLF